MSSDDITRLRRHEFPIAERYAYLNHSSYGPLPSAHVRAVGQVADEMSRTPLANLEDQWLAAADGVRERAARLMNCGASDIALLKSTTEAVALPAIGLDWRPGDRVVTYAKEFPSVVYPWLNLRDRGVEVVAVPDRGCRFELADLADAITARTRVVCLSLVNFAHGFRAPIEEVARLCAEVDALLVVDAIQAVGASVVDVRRLGADLVAAHGYKMLLSGFGVAICYCSPKARERVRVATPGWKSVVGSSDLSTLLDYRLDFPDEGRRYESSAQPGTSLRGMVASLDLLLSVGIDRIEARIAGLRSEIVEVLGEFGFTILSSQRPGEVSGVISAELPGVDSHALLSGLTERGVVCSVRAGRIRLSPHFYNTSDDVGRLADGLREVLR